MELKTALSLLIEKNKKIKINLNDAITLHFKNYS